MLKAVLNVVLFLCLVALSYLTIIRGVFLETVNAQTIDFDLAELDRFSNLSNEEIHKYVDHILKDNKIPTEVLDEVLETKEHQEIVKDYLEEAKESIKQGKELPDIPEKEIETLLTKGITKYNEKYHANISLAKVKNLVQEFTNKIDKILNLVDSNINLLSHIRFILHDTVYYSLLIITLILIIIIACLFKKEAIFSLAGISIFNGITLLITYIILKLESLQNIMEFLPINFNALKSTFVTTGIIFIITGIVLLILYRWLMIHEEKKLRAK